MRTPHPLRAVLLRTGAVAAVATLALAGCGQADSDGPDDARPGLSPEAAASFPVADADRDALRDRTP